VGVNVFITVSEVARVLAMEMGVAVRPRDISDLFYRRDVPESLGPLVGGRRLIDSTDLPGIRAALERRHQAQGQERN
jgi:hypothetical protein